MPDGKLVTSHYTHGKLIEAIRAGVAKLGKSEATVDLTDLAPVDEFHIGGRVATASFLDQVGISPTDHVLDVGCGLGGSSRFAAETYRCRVTGVDLTEEFVATGNELCAWLGLDSVVRLEVGDVTSLACQDATFDHAYMMHVGMNIANKTALIAELHRVLRPGGKLAIYDVMQVGEGDSLEFPLPWASEPAGSSLATPEVYKSALDAAGLELIAERNRRDFAVQFFAELQARIANADGPPPLGLHIVMGREAPVKIKNMIANIASGLIAPVELIARKPGN